MTIIRILFFAVLVAIAAGSYLAGGLAHKKCVWPFCRGGLQALELGSKAAQSYSGKITELQTNESPLTVYWDDLPETAGSPLTTYSALAVLEDTIVLGSQEGVIYELNAAKRWERASFPQIHLNLEEFDEAARGSGSEVYAQRSWMGLRDLVVVRQLSGELVAYVSAVRFLDGCPRLSVVRVLEGGEGGASLFQTQCLLSVSLRAVGGGLAIDAERQRLFLSVGDMGYLRGVTEPKTALERARMMRRDGLAAIYEIPTDGSAYGVYAQGLRGPLGVIFDSGRLWAAENGPQGGDEVNVVTRGADYGWPWLTFGLQYGQTQWPLNGPSEGNFVYPLFSFTPSVAPSDLIVSSAEAMENDLQVFYLSTLRGRSVFKLLVEKAHTRVISAQRFEFGERIRSIASTADLFVFTTDVTGKYGWIDGGLQ